MTDASPAVRGTALLSKSLDIVEMIADSENRLKFKDIAERTGHSKSTLYRILAALSARGMIDLDRRDQSYVLGPKFTEMAGSMNSSSELISVSAAPLRALAEQQGENVNLAILVGTAQLTISRWQGRLAQPFASPLGERKPLHATSLGKALLAFLPDDQLTPLLPRIKLAQFTARTHTTLTTLREDLGTIRARGFAIDDNEIIDGVTCVAVPILAEDGMPLASVSITAPSHRMPLTRQLELAAVLRRTAAQIAQMLTPRLAEVAGLRMIDGPQTRILDIRAFAPRILPGSVDADSLCWFDGPSGQVARYTRGQVETLAAVDRIDAACMAGDAIHLLCGDRLITLGTERTETEAPDALIGARWLSRDRDGWLVLKDGTLSRVTDETVPLLDGLLDGCGFDRAPDGRILCLRASDGAALTLSPDGTVETTPLPHRSPPTGAAFDGKGGFWIAHDLAWTICHVDASGQVTEVPVALPTLRGLALAPDGALWAGSDRLTLSQSLIDVAPASGGVLRATLA